VATEVVPETPKGLTFRLFDGSRGKKSSNDPCDVECEPVDFGKLTDSQKNDLILTLAKSKAKEKHAKASEGFKQLQEFLTAGEKMLKGIGIADPQEAQIKACASLLAEQKSLVLAFEPVTKLYLSAAEILAADSE